MSKTVDAKEGQSLAEAYALSGGTRDPRNLEIMFKATGTGANIREGLRREWNLPMDGCSLTFAPKGSYRVEHVVKFLEKDLGAADAPGDGSTAEVVLLDWYAAHLVKEVDDTIKGRGHVPMKLPGGSTAHISPPDTHAHRHQEREYRADEQWDALQQLRRGAVLPECSRATILRRAWHSWQAVPHDRNTRVQFQETGMTLPLDGSGDHTLRHLCKPFWHHPGVDMPAARARIVADIRARHGRGELNSLGSVGGAWVLGGVPRASRDARGRGMRPEPHGRAPRGRRRARR